MTYEELNERMADFFSEEDSSPEMLDDPEGGSDLDGKVEEELSSDLGEEAEEESPPEETAFEMPAEELPPPVVLSLAERVAILFEQVEQTLLDPSLRVMPENFTTTQLYSRDAEGTHFIGTAYLRVDTGEEFMVERDGKEYWL